MAAGRTFAGRTIQFWVIAAITLTSGIVGMTDVAPVWVRVACIGFGAVGVVWMVVDSIHTIIATLRTARERRRLHGH